MWFNGWDHVLRVIIMAVVSYVALILLLRISGKRTLSKMNMFDFVVTVALGSTFATIILSKDVALVEGIAALGVLILLQYVVAWLSVRWSAFQRVVKGEPSLLYYRGHYLHDAMMHNRVASEEIRSAARAQGIHDMTALGAVILETDGKFSVVRRIESEHAGALSDVTIPSALRREAGDDAPNQP